MASIKMNGVNAIEATFTELAQMTDEDREKILMAGAEVVAAKLREALERLGLKNTGQLIESVGYKIRQNKDGAPVAVVSSFGRRRGKTKKDNGTVLFVLEHGTPRMRAYHPVELTAKESEEPFAEAVAQAWGEYLTSKGI